MQNQLIEIIKFLNDQWKNGKITRNQFSFTFIRLHRSLWKLKPSQQYMDHQLIGTVLKKYKEDYIPKYLQGWIQIGTMNQDCISPLKRSQLKLNVCEYPDGCQFIAHCKVNVWIKDVGCISAETFPLRVLLTDNISKIKEHIQRLQKCVDVELRLYTRDGKAGTYETIWQKSTPLKPEETIVSCKLYTQDCFILANLIKLDVSSIISLFLISFYSSDFSRNTPMIPSSNFQIFLKTLTGKTITLEVDAGMDNRKL